jgi:DNA repair protein RecO
MKSITDTGLVLRRTLHLEKDHRLIVLLRGQGKFSLVSKGTSQISSKLKILQEPFSLIDIQAFLSHHGTHGRLTGGKLLHSFDKIRQSYEAYLVASACAEVVDMLVPFRAPSPDVFDILRNAFSRLAQVASPQDVWVDFVQETLKTLGHGDIAVKFNNVPPVRRFDIANGELEQILPWRLKSDLSSLRRESVVQQQ